MKKGKLIHLTERCIYNLSVLAAKKKTNFKNLVEGILENESKKVEDESFENVIGKDKKVMSRLDQDHTKLISYNTLFKELNKNKLPIDLIRNKINSLTTKLYQKDLIDVSYKIEIVCNQLFIIPLNFHTALLFSGIYISFDNLIYINTIETKHIIYKWRDGKLYTARQLNQAGE